MRPNIEHERALYPQEPLIDEDAGGPISLPKPDPVKLDAEMV